MQLYTIKIIGIKDNKAAVMLEADGKNFNEKVQDEICDFESSKTLKLKSMFDAVVDKIDIPTLDDDNKIISKKQTAEYYVYDEVSFFKCLDKLTEKLQECENTNKQYFSAFASSNTKGEAMLNAINNLKSDIDYLTNTINDIKYYSNIFNFADTYMFYGKDKSLVLNQDFDDYFFILQNA